VANVDNLWVFTMNCSRFVCSDRVCGPSLNLEKANHCKATVFVANHGPFGLLNDEKRTTGEMRGLSLFCQAPEREIPQMTQSNIDPIRVPVRSVAQEVILTC
jgi:hypothetical protein